MNEEMTKLIEQLANKLGTTTEYLYSALIRQAPISATIDLITFVVVIIAGFLLWKLHRYLSKKELYDEAEGLIVAPMIVAALIWAVIFIIYVFSIESILAGFLNPEYWALHRVLSLCN